MSTESPSEHLLRQTQITATARFHASARLKQHDSLSLWAVSFASLALVFVPLLQPLGITTSIADSWVTLGSTAAATSILIISLLVGRANYGARSEQMYRSGVEINAIARKVESYIQQADTEPDRLAKLQDNYDAILEKYENHADIDYRTAVIRKKPSRPDITWAFKTTTFILKHAEYLLYLVLLAAYPAFVAIVIWGVPFV
ncbi:MAG: SLATT domain-containing protein [Candidatus Thiodiazotropha sp.]